jgi:hypothetical protein
MSRKNSATIKITHIKVNLVFVNTNNGFIWRMENHVSMKY